LKGFPEAIETIYPKTAVQLCIVHMVRYSLNYVSWKLRKEIAADLRTIYAAATVDEAEHNLGEFEEKWGAAYAPIVQSWRRNWARIIPFFDYPRTRAQSNIVSMRPRRRVAVSVFINQIGSSIRMM
jgi:putative transposase